MNLNDGQGGEFLSSSSHHSHTNDFADAESNNSTTHSPSPADAFLGEESDSQETTDMILAALFLLAALAALSRMKKSYNEGTETSVVTAFYTLILMTSILRFVWFAIPSSYLEPSYAPAPVMAFHSHMWFRTFISELLLAAGSLSLFSIFILILVYWADILKKYFYPGARRSKPMSTFLKMVSFLCGLQGVNCLLFLANVYSSEGMILFDSIILGVVSLICVAEISIFSHRFRTVLRTLGAINQVSTESQVRRIVWITVTGNVFFLIRGILEISLTIILVLYWRQHESFSKAFSDDWWDTYILIKHSSEICILFIMLYILQSRFSNSPARGNYEEVHPDEVSSAQP
jgi:hypothetical protein